MEVRRCSRKERPVSGMLRGRLIFFEWAAGGIMRVLRGLVLIFVTVLVTVSALAQSAAPESKAILAVLDKQVVDWNRGDIEAFATTYKNSPDILFIGSTISRGY